jgi:uncharacterized membrane protein
MTCTGDFGVSVSPSSLTISKASSGTTVATVAYIGCANPSITLSVTGLPANVRATFTPPVVTAPAGATASSTMRIDVGANVTDGSYPVTIVATAGTVTRATQFTLVVGPVPVASNVGLAFAVIGIGVGVAASVVCVAVAMSRRGSEVFTYGGYYYCRRHRVPVWYVNGRLWCPAEQRYLRAE